jgi:hypothetical protein
MTVETANYIHQLDDTLPSNTDFLHEGDNHITLVKKALKASFATSNKQYPMDTILGGIVPIGVIAMWYSTGGSVPAGWAICDGRTVARTDGAGNITTPNLTGHFPLGGDQNTVPGDSGGSWEKNIWAANSGSHSHNVWTGNAGGHNHTGTTGAHALTIAQLPAHNHGGGAHTHTVPIMSNRESGDVGTDDSWDYRKATWNTEEINEYSWGSGTIINTEGSGHGHSHSVTWQGDHSHAADMNNAGDHTHNIIVNVTPPYKRLIFIMKH